MTSSVRLHPGALAPSFRIHPRAFAPVILLAMVFLLAEGIQAQKWTHRYPQVEGYGHHVYLEGYELPTLATGVLDPAPSPDGLELAFASRGWIWLLELETGVARRLTRGAEMDFRPVWAPDGRQLALVRDDGSESWVVVVDAGTGAEVREVRTPAIDLDPAFSPDGRFLYYSSAREGTLDIWRLELEGGLEERITSEAGIQLRPQPHPDGLHLLYLSKAGGRDRVRIRNLESGEDRILLETSTASQARPALSPDGRTVAVNWPQAEEWELQLVDVATPTLPIFLTRGEGLPLTPAWSIDGEDLYFSHSTPEGSMELRRISAHGGTAEPVEIRGWDWGESTGRLRIRTVRAGDPGVPVPARLSVSMGDGHPLLPDRGQPRFDGENGRVFFYSPGVISVEAPAGPVEVSGVQGLATPLSVKSVEVGQGEVTEVTVAMEPLWNAEEEGWLSGEHHFHLNYGGPFQVAPDDLRLQVDGEALDAASPLLANLHHRFGERELWGWSRQGHPPHLGFGQEVRSHFLGHVGLVGIHELFWPWIWGPGYQTYGEDDRPNAEAIRFAREQGGMGTYVHPVSGPDPFLEGNEGMIPVGFISDAVLGEVDGIEVVCLWSDDLGTAELWYRILNLGIPLAANAGSDVMTDFYRTMAVGTARVFVRADGGSAEGPRSWNAYLTGLREGRSFVTTGPWLDFQVEDGGGWRRPGGVVAAVGQEGGGASGAEPDPARGSSSGAEAGPAGGGEQRASSVEQEASSVRWRVDLRSAVPVERVEIVVNGEVVHEEVGLDAAGTRILEGTVELPAGGWVAARARGGESAWPLMAAEPFAHSSPVWIGSRGSMDPLAAARSAQELLRALDVAEDRLHAGYEGVEIPRLQAHFDEARTRLEGMARQGGR